MEVAGKQNKGIIVTSSRYFQRRLICPAYDTGNTIFIERLKVISLSAQRITAKKTDGYNIVYVIILYATTIGVAYSHFCGHCCLIVILIRTLKVFYNDN